MWKPMSGPRGTIPLVSNITTCQIPIGPSHHHASLCHINLCHMSVRPPATCLVWTFHVNSMALPLHQYGPATSALYGLYSQKNFACLEKKTERDISHIRHLFEPVQVALGSWGPGLCTIMFWSSSEHFCFWAYFDPLNQGCRSTGATSWCDARLVWVGYGRLIWCGNGSTINGSCSRIYFT
jgi:hypothetical protein